MAVKLFTLFFFIPIVYAQIQIDIVASNEKEEQHVKFSGSDVHIISDDERSVFQLSDSSLKDAVKEYFGKRPDDAFLKSPTPWGDLYKTYDWPQVTRSLSPKRSYILSVNSQPLIIMAQVIKNNSSKTAIFKAQISQKVQNTVKSTWDKEGELNVGQEIKYGVDIKVPAVSGTTKFLYSAKWGEDMSKSETVTVGAEDEIEITLEPHQAVTAELCVTKGSMKMQVFYEASLSGSTALNYAKKYKNHHFWSLPINSVMKSGGLKQTVNSTEEIELGYYSDPQINIRNTATDDVLYSIPSIIF